MARLIKKRLELKCALEDGKVKVAIIGAGGYLGSHLVEEARFSGQIEAVPIVRSFRGRGRLSRLGPIFSIVNTECVDELAPVLKGADSVVSCTMGDDDKMLGDIQAIYAACVKANVRKLIYISSAEVFGRIDTVDGDGQPQHDTNHWMPYARAKIACENYLNACIGKNEIQIIVLRPGLIWGPMAGWLVDPVTELLDGKAYLYFRGAGIANLVLVENLVKYIEHCVLSNSVNSGFFNVSDDELVTWKEYYKGLCQISNVDPSSIHYLDENQFHEGLLDRFKRITSAGLLKKIKRSYSSELKSQIKFKIQEILGEVSLQPQTFSKTPNPKRSIWWLQGTKCKLSSQPFFDTFGKPKLIPIERGYQISKSWLEYSEFI